MTQPRLIYFQKRIGPASKWCRVKDPKQIYFDDLKIIAQIYD